MQSHEEMRGRIPAYVLSKLEPEARRELEAHLRECKVCSEMVAVCREIASVLRDGGEDLFGGHPALLTLREYALDGEAARDSEVARHVASCAECGLDVAVWKARQQGEPALAGKTGGTGTRPLRRRFPALTLAAGLVLGVGATLLLRPLLQSGAAAPASRPETARAGASWSAPAQLLVLDGPRRGKREEPVFKVGAGQPYALLAVQPVLPPGASPAELYRFEIRSGNQVAWRTVLSAAQIWQNQEASDVTAFMIPTPSLPAGHYRLVLLRPSGQVERALLDLPFEIVR